MTAESAEGTTRELERAIEAVVLVAVEPVPSGLLAQLLEISIPRVDELCERLARTYRERRSGIALVRVAGGYRFQTEEDLAPYVERFVTDGMPARLSAAALETLAVIAYKQPVSRAQIASIRGVNVDGVVRTLFDRGLLDEVGRDPGPGNAILYGTSSLFLEKLGLDSVDQLPPLGDFVPDTTIIEALEAGLTAPAEDESPR